MTVQRRPVVRRGKKLIDMEMSEIEKRRKVRNEIDDEYMEPPSGSDVDLDSESYQSEQAEDEQVSDSEPASGGSPSPQKTKRVRPAVVREPPVIRDVFENGNRKPMPYPRSKKARNKAMSHTTENTSSVGEADIVDQEVRDAVYGKDVPPKAASTKTLPLVYVRSTKQVADDDEKVALWGEIQDNLPLIQRQFESADSGSKSGPPQYITIKDGMSLTYDIRKHYGMLDARYRMNPYTLPIIQAKLGLPTVMTMPYSAMEKYAAFRPNLPKYKMEQLHQLTAAPVGGLRECVRGQNCASFLLECATKHIPREYMTPEEFNRWSKTNRFETPNPQDPSTWIVKPHSECLLCMLSDSTDVHSIFMAEHKTASPDFCAHAFMVMTNVVGEFCVDFDEILNNPPDRYIGFWGPVPVFATNLWVSQVHEGVPRYVWNGRVFGGIANGGKNLGSIAEKVGQTHPRPF